MAGLVLCVMASLAGVPPFLGFWSKLVVLRAALQGDMLWLAIVGIVFAVIGAFYYLRVIKVMYFDEPGRATGMRERDDRPLRVVFGANALLLLAWASSGTRSWRGASRPSCDRPWRTVHRNRDARHVLNC